MSAEDEAGARGVYLAARAYCGGCPVLRHGERWRAHRERIGTSTSISAWWAARWDPSGELRRLALLSGTDSVRHRLVGVLQSARGRASVEFTEAQWRDSRRVHAPIGGFSAHGLDGYSAGCYLRLALTATDDAQTAVERASAALQQLAEDAATCGMLVTERRVTDAEARPERRARAVSGKRRPPVAAMDVEPAPW